ncbi:MAG TPA: ATP-binding cassette domain-containing protein [Actinomycetota bacterium]|nr:ATP-binding cassette domain-containing protein [Actinomycetota bacterium]
MSDVIDVESLVKVYPDGTRAVDGVTFRVEAGEMFGFLGPNGAGKTTAIRILVTLLPKTSGRAVVGGHEVDRDAERVRQMIGYAGQFIGVDIDLTGRENLVLQGRLHGLGRREADRRADELLGVVALTDAAGKRAGAYSGGMRRRLDLAQALVHRPPLVFLDEPTTGLDPQTRNALWEQLREMNAAGTTIFLTTQYMEEADRLCRRLAIIDHGRLVVEGSPEELKASVGGDVVTLSLADDADGALVERARSAVASFPGAGDVKTFDHSVAVPLPDATANLSALIRRVDEQGIPISKLSVSTPSLDEVFLKYTGERMRVEDTAARPQSSMFAGMRRGSQGGRR